MQNYLHYSFVYRNIQTMILHLHHAFCVQKYLHKTFVFCFFFACRSICTMFCRIFASYFLYAEVFALCFFVSTYLHHIWYPWYLLYKIKPSFNQNNIISTITLQHQIECKQYLPLAKLLKHVIF